jgi:hypothetical protein
MRNAGTVRAEGSQRCGVSRVLDGNYIARLDQDTCNQIERLLRSAHDEHVVGRAMQCAGMRKVTRNRAAQR